MKQAIIFLLILGISGMGAVFGSPASAVEVSLETADTRYLMKGDTIHCYRIVDGEQIRKGQTSVFVVPEGFTIVTFDVACARVAFERQSAQTPAENDHLLAVIMDNGRTRLLCLYNETAGRTWFYQDMTPYRPWKVLFADVDDDGAVEICLGVRKESPLHPVIAKRLFIYHLAPGLPPKWRGSRLSKPLTDFCFYDNGEKTILVSTELTKDDRESLNIYYWDQFGFTGYGKYYLLGSGRAITGGYTWENGELQKYLYITENGAPLRRLPKNPWEGFVDDEEGKQ